MQSVPVPLSQELDEYRLEHQSDTLKMSLDRGIIEWLDTLKNKSGSKKTEKAYTEGITAFRQTLHIVSLDLDSPASAVAPIARRWCAFSKKSTEEKIVVVSAATFNQRRAILSSFYKYALKNEVQGIQINPIERIGLRQGEKKAARPLSFVLVEKVLQSMDTSQLEGKLYKALLIVALMSGQRVAEIAGMRLKDITFEGDEVTIVFPRCKGNKQSIKKLKPATGRVLKNYLEALFPAGFHQADPVTPIWQNTSVTTPHANGHALSVRTLERICERFLGTSKFHVLRHTAAVLMLKSGATLPEIAKFLDHQNLKTTSDYLNELLGDENVYGEKMESFLGI